MRVLAELIVDDVEKIFVSLELNCFDFAAKHRKRLFSVLCYIQAFRLGGLVDFLFGNGYVQHPVYAVSSDTVVIIVITYQIIIVVREDHSDGVYEILVAVFAEDTFVRFIEIKILKQIQARFMPRTKAYLLQYVAFAERPDTDRKQVHGTQ